MFSDTKQTYYTFRQCTQSRVVFAFICLVMSIYRYYLNVLDARTEAYTSLDETIGTAAKQTKKTMERFSDVADSISYNRGFLFFLVSYHSSKLYHVIRSASYTIAYFSSDGYSSSFRGMPSSSRRGLSSLRYSSYCCFCSTLAWIPITMVITVESVLRV